MESRHDVANLILAHSSEGVQVASALREALYANNPDQQMIADLLQNPNLDQALALAWFVEKGDGEMVDRLLKSSTDRTLAVFVAAGKGDVLMIDKLLDGAPQALDPIDAIEYGGFVLQKFSYPHPKGNINAVIAKLGIQQTVYTLSSERPASIFEISDNGEKKISKEWREWSDRVIGTYPRVDDRVMPSFSEVAKQFIPSTFSPKQREEKEAQIDIVAKKYEGGNFPIQTLTAFICLIPTMKLYRQDEQGTINKIWRLIDVMVDRNQSELKGKLDSKGHAKEFTEAMHEELQQELIKSSVVGLGACTNLLSNGFNYIEKTIASAVIVHHSEEVDENVDFLKKLLYDDMTLQLAQLIAIETRQDGYVFPQGDPRQSYPATIPEIKTILDKHLGEEYRLDSTEVAMDFEDIVEERAKKMKPEKYGQKSKDEIDTMLATDAKESLNALVAGDEWPPKLQALFDSTNKTLREDGRKEFSISEIKQRFKTLVENALNYPRLWEGFIERKYPGLIQQFEDRLQALVSERKEIENRFMEGKNWSGNRESKHYRDEYVSWATKPENQGLDDRLNQIARELYEGHGSKPEFVKDLLAQYLSAKPFIESYNQQHGRKSNLDPFGLNYMNKGANYSLLGNNGNKIVMLIEGNPERVVSMSKLHLCEMLKLDHISESQLDEMKKKGTRFYIKLRNGKLSGNIIVSNVKTRGRAREEDIGESSSKKRRFG